MMHGSATLFHILSKTFHSLLFQPGEREGIPQAKIEPISPEALKCWED